MVGLPGNDNLPPSAQTVMERSQVAYGDVTAGNKAAGAGTAVAGGMLKNQVLMERTQVSRHA